MLYGTTETLSCITVRVVPDGVQGDLYQKHGDTYKSIWPFKEKSIETPEFKTWIESATKRAKESHDKIAMLDESKGDKLPPAARTYYSIELERFINESRIMNV